MADVLVIGAGPAGSTAARALAAAGVSTLLLDRASFPRHKPCGGALSARVIKRFPYLRPALDRISTHWISRLHLEGPSGDCVELRSTVPAALMIRRVEFDALLMRLASEAGAAVEEGAEIVEAEQTREGVTVTARDGRSFSGRFLIACDGVHSVTARRLGIVDAWPRRALAVDMMEETPVSKLRAVDANALWVRYGIPAPQSNGAALWEGYAYVFPKRDHVNVGIGYLLSAYRAASPGRAYDAQQALVEQLNASGVLDGGSRRECFTPFLIPVTGLRRQLTSGRVLLAGDTAGFVHAVTAEGIYYAMVSGELAARALISDDASRYPALCGAEIGRELGDSVILQRYLFSNRDRVDAVIAGARRDPAISQAVIRYFVGEVSYQRVRRALLRQNPRFILSAAWHAMGL